MAKFAIKFETPYRLAYEHKIASIAGSDVTWEFDFAEKWAAKILKEMNAGKKMTKQLVNKMAKLVYPTFGANAPALHPMAEQVLVKYWVHGSQFGEIVGMQKLDIMKKRHYAEMTELRLARY
ncbi:MAG: hypothetical protein FWE17_03010 [Alphaproteobacteria bacterium]|nr:hypothetical protein [Alphaproteobacteria bacterium]MCL2757855.1 hypothetical protein [Alphaproteobacteria bacterium]